MVANVKLKGKTNIDLPSKAANVSFLEVLYHSNPTHPDQSRVNLFIYSFNRGLDHIYLW